MAVQTKRRTFPRGGVHPHEGKERTEHIPLAVSPPPAEVAVLMQQHIGAPAQPTVKKKDEVKKGELIGQAQGYISANVHAPIGGSVKAVEERVHNPTGRRVLAVLIEKTGQVVHFTGTVFDQHRAVAESVRGA